MKKLIILSLAVLFSLPVTVYAASIGGAETQGQGKLAVGLDTSFIFERDLKFKSATNLAANEEFKNIEMEEGYQIMLKASYGLLDSLDAYIKLGATDYELSADGYVSGVETVEDKFNTNTDFAYGFGLKGIYELGDDWLLGCDLQYLRSEHKTKLNETTIATGAVSSTTYKKAIFQEWHVAPYIARKINDFIPYLGIRYSEFEVEVKSPSDSGWLDDIKVEADDNVGVFVGTDYKMGENLTLNLEGRFIDETALSFAATYRF